MLAGLALASVGVSPSSARAPVRPDHAHLPWRQRPGFRARRRSPTWCAESATHRNGRRRSATGQPGLTMTACGSAGSHPSGGASARARSRIRRGWPALLGFALGAIAFAGGGRAASRSRHRLEPDPRAQQAGGPMPARRSRSHRAHLATAAQSDRRLDRRRSPVRSAGRQPRPDARRLDDAGRRQGALGNVVGGMAGPNAQGELVDLFVVAMFSVMGAIAAICAVQAVARARQDEARRARRDRARDAPLARALVPRLSRDRPGLGCSCSWRGRARGHRGSLVVERMRQPETRRSSLRA